MIRSKAFGTGRQSTTALHHPSPAELADFALGSLSESRAAVVEGHVYRCDQCATIVADVPEDNFLKQLRSSGRALEDDGGAADGSQDTIGLPFDCVRLEELPAGIRNHPRFEIRRLIAEGAMGRVYLARERGTASHVAIKVIRPEIADDHQKLDRFLQELRIAGKLRHPNIARVIKCESWGRSALIAMEFVHGRTLAQIVGQRGPLPVDEASEYVRHAAAGLACAASHGVVHRDIKPHNLILESREKLVKIVDFGLGRLVDEQRTSSRLTREGEILGRLDYLSPEQAACSRDADIRSDICSLGCTFYFLLSGAPPFASKNAVELLRKHEREVPLPIGSLRRDVPAKIADLLDRMMQKDANLRPKSPQEILDVLGRPQHLAAGDATFSAHRLPKLRQTWLDRLALPSSLASPAVLLPVVTCLLCLMWMLLS